MVLEFRLLSPELMVSEFRLLSPEFGGGRGARFGLNRRASPRMEGETPAREPE